MPTRPERMIRWFIFSVLLSLVPLTLSYVAMQLDGGRVSLHMLMGRGELLLICTTVGAAALGELIPAGRDNAILKLLAGGCTMLVVVVSSLSFAAIQSRQSPDPGSVLAISLSMFLGMLVAGGSCMYLAHREGA